MILTANISIPLFNICFTFLLCLQNLMTLDIFLCSVAEPFNFYAAHVAPAVPADPTPLPNHLC
jgi:hypothetical protein